MQDDRLVTLRQPGDFADPLTDILRSGARRLLAQAVEAEVAAFFTDHADLTTDDGRQRLVRYGHLPERTIQTGIGPLEVRQPRVRDRGAAEGERIRFHQRSRRLTPGGPEAWMRCCLCFICAVPRRVIFRRRWRPCSARMPQICRPRCLPG